MDWWDWIINNAGSGNKPAPTYVSPQPFPRRVSSNPWGYGDPVPFPQDWNPTDLGSDSVLSPPRRNIEIMDEALIDYYLNGPLRPGGPR